MSAASLLALSVAISLLVVARGAPAEFSRTNPPLEYLIVVTGEELLRGAYADAHTHFLTRTLFPLGGHCLGSLTVDDRPEDVKQALHFAVQKAKLVLVTGGLGPTVNDITRPAVAEFTGIPLAEHPEVVADMERRFGQPREQLRANLRRQALVPTQGAYLRNPHGTAVGLVFATNDTWIVALPGPPRELQPMVTQELIPFLRQRFALRPMGASLTLRFVGAGQSLIDQTLRDRVDLPVEVITSSSFEGSRVDFTFTLPGARPEDHARLRELGRQVRAQLGEYLYADDGSTLEQQVLRRLQALGGSLVLVELTTSGGLAASLGAASGSPLKTAYVFSSEEQARTLLGIATDRWPDAAHGAERVKALAAAAQDRVGASCSVVVGPLADASGSAPGLWIAFGLPDRRCEAQRLEWRGAPETGRPQLITQILDRWRRRLP